METRLQILNDDVVLEIQEVVTRVTRHSEADLLRQRDYFQSMIDEGNKGLDAVVVLLAQIDDEKFAYQKEQEALGVTQIDNVIPG